MELPHIKKVSNSFNQAIGTNCYRTNAIYGTLEFYFLKNKPTKNIRRIFLIYDMKAQK